MKKITHSVEETNKLADEFAQKVARGGVLALHGDLGSGKTTFAAGVAHALGIQEKITSPTFIIVKQYSVPHQNNILYHIDLYRLENRNDLESLGLEEIFTNPNNIVLVEWPERSGSLPPRTQHLYFKYLDKNTREITY